MVKQRFRILSIIFMLIAVSQSSLIVPRSAPEEETSGDEAFEKDERYPGLSDPEFSNFGTNDLGINRHYRPSYPTDDDGTADEIEELGAEPESNPGEDENDIYGNAGKVNDNDDTDDDGSNGPLDGNEGLNESGDKIYPEIPIPDEGYESGKDEELGDEIGKVPSSWTDKVLEGAFKIKDFFSRDGSMFDIFNIPKNLMEKARKYYRRLEEALGRVFRQTLNEARLLNGTYANTTEEEVEIGGKKYVVQKSIIKGKDNNSTIYVETLSSKQNEEGGQETNGTETKA